jgi:hypothetical protein
VTCRWRCFEFAADDPDCARYGLGAAALRYAYWGYAVLPLQRGGKRPHGLVGRGGVHLASREPEQIKDWWSLDMSANIGVATGSASKLCVIDMDVKHGVDGVQMMRRFLAERRLSTGFGPLALTPSGGSHLWLRTALHEDAVPERPGILPGVDVKGDGGYVVAAPSMLAVVPGDRSGGTTGAVPVPYEWAGGCPHEAPPWPGWMAGWLASAGGIRAGAVSRGGQDGAGADRRGEGLAVGRRNRDMYALACSLYRRLGTSPDGAGAVLARLREVWEKTDRNGFPWSEALVCAESARRFVERSRAAEDERNRAFLAWLHRRG